MSMFHELMMKKKGMPSNYQEVEYIESVGNQYIDTGILGNSLYNYEIEYQCVNSGDRVFLCGVDESFNLKSSTFIRLTTGNFSWYYDTYGTVLFNNSDYNTAKNKIEVLYDTNSNTVTTNVYNNDTKIATTQRNIADIYNGNFYLGAINRNGSVAFDGTKRFYSAKFYNGTTLFRNFIPVYDTLTNKYGMWESVQGKFYGNAGAGNFKGSIVGYTVVGSPTIVDGVVSGFDSSNYLKIAQQIPQSSNFEISCVFTMGSSNIPNVIATLIENNAGRNGLCIYVLNSKCYLSAYLNLETSGNYLFRLPTALNLNETYTGKLKFNGSVYRLELWQNDVLVASTDYTSSELLSPTGTAGTFIGSRTVADRLFNGSININENYIKINNKLWFNGQQA